MPACLVLAPVPAVDGCINLNAQQLSRPVDIRRHLETHSKGGGACGSRSSVGGEAAEARVANPVEDKLCKSGSEGACCLGAEAHTSRRGWVMKKAWRACHHRVQGTGWGVPGAGHSADGQRGRPRVCVAVGLEHMDWSSPRCGTPRRW